MPRYVRPALPELEEAAIELFGSRIQLAIIAYLHSHPGSTVDEMAEALAVKAGTLRFQLRKLEAAGIVKADLPPAERRGRNPRYWRADRRIRELYEQLGRTAGVE